MDEEEALQKKAAEEGLWLLHRPHFELHDIPTLQLKHQVSLEDIRSA